MGAITLFNNRNTDIFDRFFGIDDFWSTPTIQQTRDLHSPIIKELDDKYQISLATPGLEKDDFKITLEGNQITISYDAGENKNSYAYATKYSKSYTIPSDCDLKKITADYKTGVLAVSLAKSESAKPRTIEVK